MLLLLQKLASEICLWCISVQLVMVLLCIKTTTHINVCLASMCSACCLCCSLATCSRRDGNVLAGTGLQKKFSTACSATFPLNDQVLNSDTHLTKKWYSLVYSLCYQYTSQKRQKLCPRPHTSALAINTVSTNVQHFIQFSSTVLNKLQV